MEKCISVPHDRKKIVLSFSWEKNILTEEGSEEKNYEHNENPNPVQFFISVANVYIISFFFFCLFIYNYAVYRLAYIRNNFCIKPGIHDASFASKSPFKFFDRVYHTRNLNQKTWTDLDWIEMHPIFFSTWMEIGQSEDRILISINLWM